MSGTVKVYKPGDENNLQDCLETALPYALRNGYRLYVPPKDEPLTQAEVAPGGAHAAASSGSTPEPATSADNSAAIVPPRRGPGRPPGSKNHETPHAPEL